MVKIVDFKTYQNDDGDDFHALVVQGGLEAVKSQQTERMYFTARKATVPCTFNETMCKSLIGQDIPGVVKKIEVEPYPYTIEGTDEVIELSHRYEFMSEEQAIVKDNVLETAEVF